MNERLIAISICMKPTNGAALGALYAYHTTPVNLTIVAVVCSATADDASLTVDINDDGTAVITAIDTADASVPGTWISTHFGGSETPVKVAADSVLSLDANSAANDTGIAVVIYALTGEAN